MTTGWLFNYCKASVGGATQRVICAFDENDKLVLKREYTITGYGEVKDCYIKEEIGTKKIGRHSFVGCLLFYNQ